ncbi:Hydroxyacylglutathione hydrolase cytoplasmic, partial [Diplonema papillatum]
MGHVKASPYASLRHLARVLAGVVGMAVVAALALLTCVLAIPAAVPALLCRALFAAGFGMVYKHVYIAHLGWLHIRFIAESSSPASGTKWHEVPGFEVSQTGAAARIFAISVLSDNYTYLVVEVPGPDARPAACCLIDVGHAEQALEATRAIFASSFGFLPDEELPLRAVLTTHHHWDHMAGNLALARKFPGIEVIGGVGEFVAGVTRRCRDGEVVQVGDSLLFDVIQTPCHTKGHVLFYLRRDDHAADANPAHAASALFSGDTLFYGTWGTRFEGTRGDMLKNAATIVERCHLSSYVHSGHEVSAVLSRYLAQESAGDLPERFFHVASSFFTAVHRSQCVHKSVPLVTIERLLPYCHLFDEVVALASCLAKAFFYSLPEATQRQLVNEEVDRPPEDAAAARGSGVNPASPMESFTRGGHRDRVSRASAEFIRTLEVAKLERVVRRKLPPCDHRSEIVSLLQETDRDEGSSAGSGAPVFQLDLGWDDEAEGEEGRLAGLKRMMANIIRIKIGEPADGLDWSASGTSDDGSGPDAAASVDPQRAEPRAATARGDSNDRVPVEKNAAPDACRTQPDAPPGPSAGKAYPGGPWNTNGEPGDGWPQPVDKQAALPSSQAASTGNRHDAEPVDGWTRTGDKQAALPLSPSPSAGKRHPSEPENTDPPDGLSAGEENATPRTPPLDATPPVMDAVTTARSGSAAFSSCDWAGSCPVQMTPQRTQHAEVSSRMPDGEAASNRHFAETLSPRPEDLSGHSAQQSKPADSYPVQMTTWQTQQHAEVSSRMPDGEADSNRHFAETFSPRPEDSSGHSAQQSKPADSYPVQMTTWQTQQHAEVSSRMPDGEAGSVRRSAEALSPRPEDSGGHIERQGKSAGSNPVQTIPQAAVSSRMPDGEADTRSAEESLSGGHTERQVKPAGSNPVQAIPQAAVSSRMPDGEADTRSAEDFSPRPEESLSGGHTERQGKSARPACGVEAAGVHGEGDDSPSSAAVAGSRKEVSPASFADDGEMSRLLPVGCRGGQSVCVAGGGGGVGQSPGVERLRENNSCIGCSPPCSRHDPFVTLFTEDVEALELKMALGVLTAKQAALALRKLRAIWAENSHLQPDEPVSSDAVREALLFLGTDPSESTSPGGYLPRSVASAFGGFDPEVSVGRLLRILGKLPLNLSFPAARTALLFFRAGGAPGDVPRRLRLSEVAARVKTAPPPHLGAARGLQLRAIGRRLESPQSCP